MGRVGRAVLRGGLERPDSPVEVVAVNDVAPVATLATLAHLLRYDSTYGRWSVPVEADGAHLRVGGHLLRVSDHARAEDLDWRDVGVDVVVEATGRLRDRAAVHRERGARKVVVTAPAPGADATIVWGVNDGDHRPETHHVVSAASCTTNCAAPMAEVLDRAFGVRRGLLTTVHSYTGDQNLLDGPHEDLRRARSAATNMIPTSTGAARAIGQVLPALAGLIDGVADGRLKGSCAAPTTRSCPVTCSATPRPACSTPGSPRSAVTS